MEDVTIAHAKEQLEELIQRAARGEDVRISDPKAGGVRLVRLREADVAAPRVTNTMKPILPLSQRRRLSHQPGKMHTYRE